MGGRIATVPNANARLDEGGGDGGERGAGGVERKRGAGG